MKILEVTSLKVRKKTDVYTFFNLPGGIMKTLVSIVGPTAIGKTKVSITVAQHLNTEIISADARQFYRGMRIGTAAPTDVQLSLVRHHFVNEIPVTTQFSAGDFAKAALSRLETLFITHDAVVLTGGSGLFIKALLKGLDVFPPVSKEVVDQLNALYEMEGIGVLQAMLHEKDPPYYELVDRSNPQRLLRALAVCVSSGKRYSEFRKSDSASRDFNSLLIGLHTDRKQLYARIDARVDQMMADGLLARTSNADPVPSEGNRAKHDAIVGAVRTSARGEFALVTSRGRMIRLSALELPALPPLGGAPALSGGAPLAAYVDLPKGEEPLTIVSLSESSPGVALGTAQGVVKRVTTDYPRGNDWEAITLKDGDTVVGAAELVSGEEDLVFITSDAQLLRFGAASVRPQGRAAGGMAGIRLGARQRALFFGAVNPDLDAVVVTASGSSSALPGTQAGAIKVTPYAEYPAKGRATGGVRAHRFLKGEDTLVVAWAGALPARACGPGGVALELPPATGKRDGSGTPYAAVIAGIGAPVPHVT